MPRRPPTVIVYDRGGTPHRVAARCPYDGHPSQPHTTDHGIVCAHCRRTMPTRHAPRGTPHIWHVSDMRADVWHPATGDIYGVAVHTIAHSWAYDYTITITDRYTDRTIHPDRGPYTTRTHALSDGVSYALTPHTVWSQRWHDHPARGTYINPAYA